MRPLRSCVLAFVIATAAASHADAQTPVAYRLSFSEREHHVMQVDITFPDVPQGPLQVRMSRSSPGRYSIRPGWSRPRSIQVVAGRVAHVRVGILRATTGGESGPRGGANAAPGRSSAD